MFAVLLTILFCAILLPVGHSLVPGCSFVNGQCSYTVKLGHAGQCDETRDSKYPNPIILSTPPVSTDCCAATEKQISSLQVDLLNKLVEVKNQLLDVESRRNVTAITTEALESVLHNNKGGQFENELAIQRDKLDGLETRLDEIVYTLNQTKENLTQTENELNSKENAHQKLLVELKSKEVALKGSTNRLGLYKRQVGDELERLRNELARINSDLMICRGALHASTGQGVINNKPVLYGDIKVTRCTFEDGDHLCGYTQDRSDNGDWSLGHASEDGSSTGPPEDHSFGSPYGHYWYVSSKHLALSSSAARTETVRLTSTEFPPAMDYCIKFSYSMYGDDIRTLNVYASVNSGLGYPVFKANGNKGINWFTAEVHLDSEYTHRPFKIVFEGTTNSYKAYSHFGGYHYYNQKGDIAIDDVYVYNTSCKAIPKCPPGATTRADNLGNDSCYTFHTTPDTWYKAYEMCRTQEYSGHLVTINDKDEQDFLVKEIKERAELSTAGDYGFWTSGNDAMSEAHFQWTETGVPYSMNYTNWKLGQPNNVADDQDCLLMQYPNLNYQWGDVDCDEIYPYICEFSH